VLVLTLNEERHIKRCIESLMLVTKNIFIIDSFSSDSTVKVAESLGVSVYKNKWPGSHAEQFNWALENCPIETPWVMKMDADEIILPELAQEIKSKLPSIETSITGIYLKRRVCFMNHWIKHGGYYPTWLMRIWRFNAGKMEQRWMDEHVKLRDGKHLYFEHDIVDNNMNDLTWWTTKHNHYSVKEAADILNTIYSFEKYDEIEPKLLGTQEQRKRKLKYYYAKLPLFVRPLIYFIWRYFFKLGFLDGKKGLVWHVLQGFWYRFLVDAKLYEIKSKAGKDSKNVRRILKNDYGIDL
jgi:glycosyltransferase involved in cell wall biosynthesis